MVERVKSNNLADFERRPSTPVRSRSSPDKQPICSGLFTTPLVIGSPTKNSNNNSSSSSKFTPTRKPGSSSSAIGSPSITRITTGSATTTIRSPQFISTTSSPLRASLTTEAIPRKRSILPGAPNPSHHLRTFKYSPSLLRKSQSHLTLSSAAPVSIKSPQPINTTAATTTTTVQEPLVISSENVLVAIRIKGIVADHVEPPKPYWSINDAGTQITELSTTSNWNFDSILGQSANNLDVYRRSGSRDLILSAMAGYDATIFAYGQTASGKTHTLTGSNIQPGIIPLSVEEIFSYIRSHPEREFLLRVSYLEVYNEQIHDLLVPSTQPCPTVKIRQQTNGQFFADPVREEVVTNLGQVMNLIHRGERQRHVAGTDWNARSSRSHTIFSIVIESRLFGVDGGGVTRSKVCLIDLAGNERASSEVQRRSEGSFINKSLLTLEKVISGLGEDNPQSKTKSNHIPYRDSKLTQILQPSLSGKSRVCVICTINSSFKSIEDSRSTLRFASRVKKIITNANLNEILSDNALMIRYRQQILDLQNQLKVAVNQVNSNNENINLYHQQHSSPKVSNSVIVGDTTQNLEMQKKAEEERKKIKKQLKELQSIILNADTLDQIGSLSEFTRPVSPVKKPSFQGASRLSEPESEDSDDSAEDQGIGMKSEKEEENVKSKREKVLEEKLELQAYEIACLRLELIGLKFKSTKKNKKKNRDQLFNHQIESQQEDDDDIQDHQIEEAMQRVAESRESIENRLSEQALEIKNRKKYSNQVLLLLDASRAKTRKLELFLLKEIEKSTRRLSRIERTAYIENLNTEELDQDEIGEGNEKLSGRRRRRSSSINTNPYGLLLSNPSSLSSPSSPFPHDQHQNQLMNKLKNNLNLQSPNVKDYHQDLSDRDSPTSSNKEQRDHHHHHHHQLDEEDEDDQEISTLLSIVNETPELECIRMSFGEPNS
ncbi:hypothetical protein MJO28_011014 [Puccinia striiformis f. sp. tritici]|uniref:Kinesin-like protein n=2 Tax=Puccinia striiformis TaxID=27350 RepID=A0A2S4UM27_9BASI|nr:hypothetical protein MJO28_011014 [Puccinia striiformis f. sp. tritici]POV98271.1 hypothetical protein PSHT_14109 [Puccinia striiformis]